MGKAIMRRSAQRALWGAFGPIAFSLLVWAWLDER